MDLRSTVKRALEEDGAFRDVTSPIVGEARARGRFVAKQDLVVCGLDVAREVFRQAGASFVPRLRDGARAKKGDVLAIVSGRAQNVLAGERVALNFLQRLSGIATLTRRFVDRAKPAKVLDTRKTTPGLRALEKRAVACGGGRNHRMGLHDAVLIKDNHVAAVGDLEALREKVYDLRARDSSRRIEIEAQTLEQALVFSTFPIDVLMLDNFPVGELRRAVRLVRAVHPKLTIEASGGVTLEKVKAIAATGVDWISVGALTHSAPACDISLEL